MYWNYRVLLGKDYVYIGEVMYDENNVPGACTEESYRLEGYDYNHGMDDSEKPFDKEAARQDVINQLEMILEDIKKRPEVLDPDKDMTGDLFDLDAEATPLDWEELLNGANDDIQD